jgi:hypothetical protein
VFGAPFATAGDNPFQGVAYVFSEAGGAWAQTQKIIATEGMAFDTFGISISLSGPDLVVGAPFYNGGEGEAFLFSSAGAGDFIEQHLFTASDAVPGAGAGFGFSAAVSDGTPVFGSVFSLVGNNEKQGATYFYAPDAIFANGFD